MFGILWKEMQEVISKIPFTEKKTGAERSGRSYWNVRKDNQNSEEREHEKQGASFGTPGKKHNVRK
jgi:hypothetical protein